MFILAGQQVHAAGNLQGKVTDRETGKPLGFVNVSLHGTTFKTMTDRNGNYLLKNIPEGKYIVMLTYIGYNTFLKDIEIKKDQTTIQNFSLQPIYRIPGKTIYLPEIFITATRTKARLEDIPGSNEIISKEQMNSLPGNNVDDYLLSDAAIHTDRDKGIFSKNSSVTLRGMNASYRTLILIDGVPINKADGGGINWNRINPVKIDRIEIAEGPGSALYGGNAMGGVINVISKNPVKKIEGTVNTFYGTYNTFGGSLFLQGTEVKKDKGFYWEINGFFRKGDGYIIEPDSTRDSTDVKLFIREGGASGKVGYHYNKNNLEVEYSWYDDKRGDGVRIYDPEGGFFKYTTNYIRTAYKYNGNKTKIEANGFYQLEDYFNQKESIKTDKVPPFAITQYVLYKTVADRIDKGIWFTISRKLIPQHNFTAGVDVKAGSVDGSDIYFTSSDTVTNRGKMNLYAFFLQDEINLLNDRLNIIAGVRLDAAQFYAGSFEIKSPTAETDILMNYIGKYRDTICYAISPKIAIQYKFTKNLRLYISAARGFRPGTLDDMCRNGNVGKGIKLANPDLKPETIDNIEAGGEIKLIKKIIVKPVIYYSIGRDFQYFVGTGDTNYSGTKPKPVLRRENISRVGISGFEIKLKYLVKNNLELNCSYSHNHSVITHYDLTKYIGKDLTGKYLMEVAPNDVFAGITWRNKYFSSSLVWHFMDKRYSDDENLIEISAHNTFDFKIISRPYRNFTFSLDVQNLLNKLYLDNKNQLGLGRFIMMGISWDVN